MLFTHINYFLSNVQDVLFYCQWVGVGGFSKVLATFNHVGGSFKLLWPPPGCLNNAIFSGLGLCAACWARFMCHHELWPTSVSDPFSSINTSLGYAGGKLPCLSLDLFFKILLFQVTFLIFFSIAIFSPYLLLESKLWPVDCGLSMWGKIMMTPMYKL